jgi:hypothetical protein
MEWFLAAIDAQACVDGGPEPDLSWFEREFLKDNTVLYCEQRLRRMTLLALLNEMAIGKPSEPNQPGIDMSRWTDKDVINSVLGHYGESAIEELVKRANAKSLTVADYVTDVVRRAHTEP